jgi:hypothetical protein
MAALARYWNDWVQRYTSDGAYWYVPKRKSIADVATIRRQLKLLSQFEGALWRESQRAYLADLRGCERARRAEARDGKQSSLL